MTNNILEIKSIKKSFSDNLILNDISLSVKSNEFVTLLGPSGCGKTTLLRIIGGFENPDDGQVIFNGEDITDLPPYKREINTVFQKYALFPHMNVFENIAFGLKIKKLDNFEITNRVKESLSIVSLDSFEKRTIDSLSGGQQQRVAIARALVNQPKVLLLDEPLGALDLKIRQKMQVELKKIQQSVGITFIFVTHDQEEALTMSDTVVVLKDGEIQQIGSPIDIYNEPKNSFVADFIGESNILPAIMHEDYKVEFSNNIFTCVDKGFKKDERVEVVIRPEDVELTNNKGMLNGKVLSAVFKGVHYEMTVDVNGEIYLVQSTVEKKVGSDVGINIEPDLIHVMRKEV